MLPEIELTHRWSGQVIETPDGLPYIGKTADHQYAATGFSGNGMTFGTLAGDDGVATRSLGRHEPVGRAVRSGRAAIRRGLWDYIKENTDYPYYMMRDRFAGAEGKSLRAVKRGHGKIIEHDGQKVAAYRDPDGASTIGLRDLHAHGLHRRAGMTPSGRGTVRAMARGFTPRGQCDLGPG